MNNEKIITGAFRSRTDKSWRQMSYGCFEPKRDTYTDIDCDGSFDIKDRLSADGETSKYIYSNGSWIAVTRRTSEKVIRKKGEETVIYVFDDES